MTAPNPRPPEGGPTVDPTPALTGRGGVRPLVRTDLPAVAALRRQVFQETHQDSAEDLIDYLARVFLDNPWRDLDLPSLVHVDGTGAVNGFLGVVPRRMQWRDRTIRVAVPTQLMVRSGSAPGAGTRLARAFWNGPQDLTFSDAANDAARRVWSRVGGIVAVVPSLQFVYPVRPLRHALGRRATNPVGRTLAFLGRPVAAFYDRARRPARGIGPQRAEHLDLPRHLPLLQGILASWPLRPDYDPIGFRWQIEEVMSRHTKGPLTGYVVRDPHGEAVGWFLYHANRGGVGEIVQLGAKPGEQGRVLAPLLVHAYERGVVALSGRLESGLFEPLTARGIPFTRSGPWVLIHARDPELRAAVLAGEGFFSRLDGEWWLNF